MELKPGSRWISVVCKAEVIVVRPAAGDARLECGGHPMVPAPRASESEAQISPEFAAGTLVGKRYFDADSGLEVLAAKGGAGSLSVDGRPLSVREAKALPSSD